MFKKMSLIVMFAIISGLLIFNSPAKAASTLFICLEASCSSMSFTLGGQTHSSKLSCDNSLIGFTGIPAGTYSWSASGCGLTSSGTAYMNGTSIYLLTLCPPSGWPCCSKGCGTGGAYKCSGCSGSTTTTTTTATTTTSATTTTAATTTLPATSGALVIQDSSGSRTFTVEDDGLVLTGRSYNAQGQYPGFWLDETGTGHKGAYFVLDENWVQVQRRAQGFGAYEASPVFINIGAPGLSISVAESGNVGFGVFAAYPLQMASGAYCTAGGVWTNASSREYKTDIQALSAQKAMDALTQLNPVEFAYKADRNEKHVGFIAEDAPDLVAARDRKGMSPMDVVAVLTKVVQEQQKLIREQKEIAQNQQITIDNLSEKVADLEGKLKSRNGLLDGTRN